MIPKIIHQTYKKIDTEFCIFSNYIKYLNPQYKYRFYDDNECERFIKEIYGIEFLKRYHKINPIYGAARADFFRYLLMYEIGGIYLDIKASIDKPFDSILKESDNYILSYWDKILYPGDDSLYYMFWNKTSNMWNYGEYMQWFIICEPKHIFLKNVIMQVIKNIDEYTNKFEYLFKFNIYFNTGPIVYSNVIDKLLDNNYRLVNIERDFGIHYSSLYTNFMHHLGYDETHYSQIREPLILK